MSEFRDEVKRLAVEKATRRCSDPGITDYLAAAEAVHDEQMAALRAENERLMLELASTNGLVDMVVEQRDRLRVENTRLRAVVEAAQGFAYAAEIGVEHEGAAYSALREALAAFAQEDAENNEDLSDCPYWAYYNGRSQPGDGIECARGCHDEPECVTCQPEGGWPMDRVRDALARHDAARRISEAHRENARLRAELGEANEQLQAMQATSVYDVGFEHGATFALTDGDGVRWRAVSGPTYSGEFGAHVAVLAQADGADQEAPCRHVSHFMQENGPELIRVGVGDRTGNGNGRAEPCPEKEANRGD